MHHSLPILDSPHGPSHFSNVTFAKSVKLVVTASPLRVDEEGSLQRSKQALVVFVACGYLFAVACFCLFVVAAAGHVTDRNEPAELHQKQPNEQPHLSQSVTFDFVDRYVQNNLFEGYFPSLFQKNNGCRSPKEHPKTEVSPGDASPSVSRHMKNAAEGPLPFSVSSEGQGMTL